MRVPPHFRELLKEDIASIFKQREKGNYDYPMFTVEAVRDLLGDLEDAEKERDALLFAVDGECHVCVNWNRHNDGENPCHTCHANGGAEHWEFDFEKYDQPAKDERMAKAKEVEPTAAPSEVAEPETQDGLQKGLAKPTDLANETAKPETESAFDKCLFYPGAITCIVEPCAHYASGECDGRRLQGVRMPGNATHGGEM